MTATTTKTKPEAKPSDAAPHWPPLAHVVWATWKPGDRALCGAEIEGIPMDGAENVCEKCKAAVRALHGDG